jgi:uncharacterized membrane protein
MAAVGTTSRAVAARRPTVLAVRWSAGALVATTWASAAIFGAYILAFYGGAAPRGTLGDWNRTLPRLYEAATPAATAAMAAHFLTGAILLVLGPVQLLGAVRRRYPALHRWLGRVYVGAAALAGLAGLTFIALKGTVGGPVMSAGFGLYGALMTLAAARTYAHARAAVRPPSRLGDPAVRAGHRLLALPHGVRLLVRVHRRRG